MGESRSARKTERKGGKEMKKLAKIIIGVWIVYFLFLAWSIMAYIEYCDEVIARYEQLIPGSKEFVDPLPYIELWYGRAAVGGFLVVLLITAILIAILGKSAKKTSLTVATILTLLILPLSTLNSFGIQQKENLLEFQVESSPEPIYVNTLIYFDEECTDAARRESTWKQFFEYSSTDTWRPATRFKNFFDITFVPLNGWDEFWDSEDSQTDAYYLLQEAIRELGGVYDSKNKWWVWQQKDYHLGLGCFALTDFLIVVTNQAMDLRGLSPPMWNAMIIRFDVGQNVLIHELSHQFNVPHCSNFCVMNPTYADITWNWCTDCKNKLYNNREKWGYKEYLNIFVEPPTGGVTDPSKKFRWQTVERVRGSTTTIKAYPNLNGYLSPVADAFVCSDNPSKNYGDSWLLYVTSYGFESYFKFSLAQIPSGLTIKSAKLFVYSIYAYGWNKPILAAFVSDDSWDESTITWQNKPPVTNTIAEITVNKSNTWYCLDITSWVRGTYYGDKQLSLCLKAKESYVDAMFSSKDDLLNGPYLELVFAEGPSYYVFDKWIFQPGNIQYTTNPITFVVTQSMNITAVFTLVMPSPPTSSSRSSGGSKSMICLT